MANAIITFYGDTQGGGAFPLQYNKNFAIDDINVLLTRYTIMTPLTIQYIKHDLDISVKIVLNESYQAPINTNNLIKYVSIQNNGETPVFYYVLKCDVLSQSCIKLSLKCDTINSLLTLSTPRRLTFTNKTKVIKEHQDRFYQTITRSRYQKRIPLLSEGITPRLYKKSEDIINYLEAGDYAGRNWYLIYKTDYLDNETPAGLNNPVKMYLLNDLAITVEGVSGDPRVFNYDNLGTTSAQYLAFTRLEGNTGKIETYANESGTGTPTNTFTTWNTLTIKRERVETQTGVYENILRVYVNGSLITSQVKSVKLYPTFTYGAIITHNPSNLYELSYLINSATAYPIYTSAGKVTIPFNSLDRTDQKLVKIIALPYCPIKYTLNNGVFTSDINISFRDNMIALPLNIEFNVDLTNIVSGHEGTYSDAMIGFTPTLNATRYLKDSKLLHSDYFIKKYVYDSFNYVVKFENIFNNNRGTTYALNYNKVYLKYLVSNGIKSAFAFDVKPSFSNIEDQDYDYLIVVNRNNEIATYDSAYINYLRVGYNVDVKNKNRQEATTWIGVGLGVAGTIAGAVTGNALLTAGSVISTLGSITSALSSTISQENNLQAKINQLQNQKASVLNADDFYLLSQYSSNKVSLQVWSASDQVLNLLDDLFYYTGYTTNEYKIPLHNNRVYFDFLQCEPVFTSVFNWSDEIVKELTAKLNEGVTFIHRVANGGANYYDTAQALENWERSIIE